MVLYIVIWFQCLEYYTVIVRYRPVFVHCLLVFVYVYVIYVNLKKEKRKLKKKKKKKKKKHRLGKIEVVFQLTSIFLVSARMSSSSSGCLGKAAFINCDTPRTFHITIIEFRCEKTGHRGFQPGPIQTRLYSHRR